LNFLGLVHRDHMAVLFLVFWEIAILISIVTRIYILNKNLHSYQQCIRVPFSLCPLQHVLLFIFLIAILTGVRWSLNVVFICISLMAKDTHNFSLENVSFKCVYSVPLPIYWLDYLFFWCLIFWVLFIFCLLVLLSWIACKDFFSIL
jgi:hypothetical protein